jgi:hypothetical protein
VISGLYESAYLVCPDSLPVHQEAPEEILQQYPDLSVAEVHSALAYYYDNVEDIEAELANEEQATAGFERRKAELLARR